MSARDELVATTTRKLVSQLLDSMADPHEYIPSRVRGTTRDLALLLHIPDPLRTRVAAAASVET